MAELPNITGIHDTMAIYAIRRAARIIRDNPLKLFMAFTPHGWGRLFELMNERQPSPEAIAAFNERMDEQRKDFEGGDDWDHQGDFSVRKYDTYEEYLDHQKEKLTNSGYIAYNNPEKAVRRFRKRFELVSQLPKPASILCMGACTGEEVRAFVGLGHFAIGIDLNPGPDSEYVVAGDFHALNFADQSVDCVYVNCLDHAFELEKILKEVRRVLKHGGIFLVDIVYGYEENFSVGNRDTTHWPTARKFADYLAETGGFEILSYRDLKNYDSNYWTQSVLRKK